MSPELHEDSMDHRLPISRDCCIHNLYGDSSVKAEAKAEAKAAAEEMKTVLCCSFTDAKSSKFQHGNVMQSVCLFRISILEFDMRLAGILNVDENGQFIGTFCSRRMSSLKTNNNILEDWRRVMEEEQLDWSQLGTCPPVFIDRVYSAMRILLTS